MINDQFIEGINNLITESVKISLENTDLDYHLVKKDDGIACLRVFAAGAYDNILEININELVEYILEESSYPKYSFFSLVLNHLDKVDMNSVPESEWVKVHSIINQKKDIIQLLEKLRLKINTLRWEPTGEDFNNNVIKLRDEIESAKEKLTLIDCEVEYGNRTT